MCFISEGNYLINKEIKRFISLQFSGLSYFQVSFCFCFYKCFFSGFSANTVNPDESGEPVVMVFSCRRRTDCRVETLDRAPHSLQESSEADGDRAALQQTGRSSCWRFKPPPPPPPTTEGSIIGHGSARFIHTSFQKPSRRINPRVETVQTHRVSTSPASLHRETHDGRRRCNTVKPPESEEAPGSIIGRNPPPGSG